MYLVNWKIASIWMWTRFGFNFWHWNILKYFLKNLQFILSVWIDKKLFFHKDFWEKLLFLNNISSVKTISWAYLFQIKFLISHTLQIESSWLKHKNVLYARPEIISNKYCKVCSANFFKYYFMQFRLLIFLSFLIFADSLQVCSQILTQND